MNVFAFSTSHVGDWRWRIVNLRGETVEESSASYPTISAAVAAGEERRQRGLADERPPIVRMPSRRRR
jgi:hypothetical protein